jgi:hypothetical protein
MFCSVSRSNPHNLREDKLRLMTVLHVSFNVGVHFGS